jgi:signal transduction histidine kinase/ligand-binding sensor domain-containing protein
VDCVTAMRHGTPATQDMRTDNSHPLACGQVVLALLCVSALTLCSPPSFALDPSLHISQYAHKSWKTRDRFSAGIIDSIAQSADGYLWLGTEFGLLRFDGVRAEPWDPPSPHLPSADVSALLTARDGSLWIGTWKGLASWKSGELKVYPQLAGLLVRALMEDHDGTIWAGGFGYGLPGKLCAIQHGNVRCYGEDGTLGNGVLGLHEDGKQRLWAGGLNGFWRWIPGPPEFHPLAAEPYGIQSIAEDDGSLYIAVHGRLKRFSDGTLVDAVLPANAPATDGGTVLRDRDGGYWYGTVGRGLIHAYQGNIDTFALSDGLSGDLVSALFEDREGSIWVATTKGVDRFSAYPVSTFSEHEGLPTDPDTSALAVRNGSVWFNAQNRFYRLDRSEITSSRTRSEPTAPAARDVQWRPRTITVSGLPNHYATPLFFQDDDGRIWLASTAGVGYLERDRFVSVEGAPGGIPYAMAGDKSGNLWISNFDAGLVHLLNGRLVQQIPWTALDRNDLATALAVDPSQRGLWLGFSKGGLAYFSDGRIRTFNTAAEGLGQGRVSDLRFDRDGTLWAATEGGLSRVKDGRVVTLNTRNGLPCDNIFWSVEDELRSLWLYESCGLVRIDRAELDAWTAARTSHSERLIHTMLLDNFDGVTLLGDVGGSWGGWLRASKSPDGRIWFPTRDGLSVIDPSHFPINKLPPPVQIEQIAADSKIYWHNLGGNTSSSPPRLPPLVRDLTIDYTALSLVVPEKVRFRFKLEGQDHDWREVVNIRQVQYSNLAPGNYRFHVIASNNSGVWNERGAALDFSIAPAYWQTYWFRTACVATFLSVLWALYQLRLRQIARGFDARLEERVAERTRIARDLHDTLLQSFQGLLLRFQTAYTLFDTRPAAAKEVLGSSIDQTAQAITEGREVMQGLRASTVECNDLAQAITTLGEQLSAEARSATSAELHVEVEGTPKNLHPIVRDEIYRVASEVLRNAFRHAEARQIEVEFRYDQRQLRLRVRDDGKGIDAKFLTAEGRAGHFGLHGMRERAKLMGGKLTVWTAADPVRRSSSSFRRPALTPHRHAVRGLLRSSPGKACGASHEQ